MTVERGWLLGAWELVEWTISVDGVDRGHPFGPDARGQLLYGDEHMSAVLSRAARPPFGTRLATQATAEQQAEAMTGYVSYAGPWDLEVEGDGEDGVARVVHHVRLCLFPDWVGTDLVRVAERDGEALVLTSEPEATSAGPVVHRLEWRRAAS